MGNGTGRFHNSIFNNSTGGNVYTFGSAPLSEGFNLSSDNGGGYFTGPGDIINTNPMLGPLADNGGSTKTHALLAGSPAINAGGFGWQADQRDYPRIGQPDIGAFEFDSAAVLITAIQRLSDGSIQLDGKALVSATFSVFASPDPVTGSFTSLGTATSNQAGDWHYIDTGAVGLAKRFYRASYP
jgi:hypothetical protein